MVASASFLLLRRSSSLSLTTTSLFLHNGSGRRALCTASSSTLPRDETAHVEVYSKTKLLQQEGLSEQQIKVVLAAEPRSDKLALLLHLLKVRGIAGTTAGAFLCSNPTVVNADLNKFRLKLEVLEDAGLGGALLLKIISMRAGIFSLSSSPQNLQKHVSFLKDLGLDPPNMCITIARLPEILKLSVDNNIKRRCELLYSKGLSKEGLFQILRNYPKVFTGSEKPALSGRLELLERFGFDLKSKSGVRALGLWSMSSHGSLLAKFEYLQTIGFSHEQAVAMVRRQPSVLCMREESLRKKVDYLLHSLHRDIPELLSCPSFLTSSLEKKLIPRFNIVNQLKEKGLLEKRVPMCAVVSVADKAFEKRFKV